MAKSTRNRKHDEICGPGRYTQAPARAQLAAPGGEQPGHRTDGVAVVGCVERRRRAGMFRRRRLRHCSDESLGNPFRPADGAGVVAYTGLAAIAFVRRTDKQWSYAWTAALFGVSYSVYLTVVSLTILESACPYCLTSLGLALATLALVVVQRPVETAHRSWLGLVGGRGVLAALVILLPRQLRRSAGRARRAGRPESVRWPSTDRSRCVVLRRVLVSALSGTEAALRRIGKPPSVHRMQPRWTQYPRAPSCNRAGVQSYPTWVINGQAFAGQVLSLARTCRDIAVSRRGDFQLAKALPQPRYGSRRRRLILLRGVRGPTERPRHRPRRQPAPTVDRRPLRYQFALSPDAGGCCESFDFFLNGRFRIVPAPMTQSAATP